MATASAGVSERPGRPLARIDTNVVHFGRFLRQAGLPVGPDRIVNALRVLSLVGVKNRDDVRAALACVLLDRHENRPVFDSAFELFWEWAANPGGSESLLQAAQGSTPSKPGRTLPTRLLPMPTAQRIDQLPLSEQPDVSASFSDRERLMSQDFAAMTREEFQMASELVRKLHLPLPTIQTRRSRAASRGHINLRRSARQMVRAPDTLPIARQRRIEQEPPLVVLLDISGSMQRYARMFLHFTHGLVRRYHKVDTLVFGTRLTNISRQLRDRDVDVALDNTARAVKDWHGGTRIGTSLQQFNRLWARRLLVRNATLILVTDGLDRDDGPTLAREAARLRRFARRIIWLNPLLRYDAFEPRAAGIRTLLPLTDFFLPVHNVNSLAELGNQLNRQI